MPSIGDCILQLFHACCSAFANHPVYLFRDYYGKYTGAREVKAALPPARRDLPEGAARGDRRGDQGLPRGEKITGLAQTSGKPQASGI